MNDNKKELWKLFISIFFADIFFIWFSVLFLRETGVNAIIFGIIFCVCSAIVSLFLLAVSLELIKAYWYGRHKSIDKEYYY